MRPKLTLLMAGIAVLAVIAAMSAGCTGTAPGNETPNATTNATPTGTAGAAGGDMTLRIATTTSLENTGLLAALEEQYENLTGVDLQITAQGTGQALELGERCDVDVVLVHAPPLEEEFIDGGYGIDHRCFAYNFFIIVGPEDDPAGIRGAQPEEAFQTLYQLGTNNTEGVAFVSRGDNSGTHSQEKAIWEAAGYNYTEDIQNSGTWYIEAGRSMGETLTLANEEQGYVLTDEGTYLSFRQNLDLVPIVEQGDELLNRYSVMAVNPDTCPSVNYAEAVNFINWLTSDETKQFIGEFGVEEFGQPLFTPLYAPQCTEPPFNCTCAENVTA
ncbi:tungsten ABC transporter substrate-binding protein [Methanoculleus taiwanensis]|uniref:Tungsten ABC transporter substrate-binding protein n=1 Tax=Methanoculleus taiwanensis TaxID=1550565 RepID=A0A498H6X9_9EURY|nr:substrate-binding domain-containing protein [Methanoculleus taiwanensis]RXE57334.1 tungsten ABC transporter substrate-binding protein [Methanoculleus taiwanensis]